MRLNNNIRPGSKHEVPGAESTQHLQYVLQEVVSATVASLLQLGEPQIAGQVFPWQKQIAGQVFPRQDEIESVEPHTNNPIISEIRPHPIDGPLLPYGPGSTAIDKVKNPPLTTYDDFLSHMLVGHNRPDDGWMVDFRLAGLYLEPFEIQKLAIELVNEFSKLDDCMEYLDSPNEVSKDRRCCYYIFVYDNIEGKSEISSKAKELKRFADDYLNTFYDGRGANTLPYQLFERYYKNIDRFM